MGENYQNGEPKNPNDYIDPTHPYYRGRASHHFTNTNEIERNNQLLQHLSLLQSENIIENIQYTLQNHQENGIVEMLLAQYLNDSPGVLEALFRNQAALDNSEVQQRLLQAIFSQQVAQNYLHSQ